ncbi:retrovirus-related pol polyprotein from transposon TNT 1-94 [Tanacetum coccineum]
MEECYRALTHQLDWINPEDTAARYTMEGIKDMIPTLWSPVKIAYDKDAALEISHWGPQLQYVQVEKKSGYGYLKDIVVRRADQKLYKFKEVKEPYTLNYDPSRVIYEENSKKKRLMCVDEIHKFCDGTLQSVRNVLHQRLKNFSLGYNKDMPLREWTTKDKRRIGIMLNKIDDQLFKRRVLKSLEVLVGEPTSNKLCGRFDTYDGNPVKEILLNLNLPDYRSVLTKPEEGFKVKMDMDEDVSRRVQVKFVTKLKASLKVPKTSIALPSTLTRSGLSAIVNNLLQSFGRCRCSSFRATINNGHVADASNLCHDAVALLLRSIAENNEWLYWYKEPSKPMRVQVKMDMDEDVSRRVQVKFVTKLKAPLKVPETSIALPSTLTRSGLSAIVNNLLQSGN